MKSSPPQQDAVSEAWTADLLFIGQWLYHWAILVLWYWSIRYWYWNKYLVPPWKYHGYWECQLQILNIEYLLLPILESERASLDGVMIWSSIKSACTFREIDSFKLFQASKVTWESPPTSERERLKNTAKQTWRVYDHKLHNKTFIIPVELHINKPARDGQF